MNNKFITCKHTLIINKPYRKTKLFFFIYLAFNFRFPQNKLLNNLQTS